jgi:hypothetical protein
MCGVPVPPARVGTTGVFLVHGAIVGSWIAQIPFVADRFGLADATLGFLLLAMSVGVVVAFPFAGQAIAREGSRRVMALVGAVFCLVLLAPHPLATAGALLVMGVLSATVDIAMNAHGVGVEERLGRPIMSSLHAGWAFGGLVGAGLAALGTVAGLDPRAIVAVTAALTLMGLALALRSAGPGIAGKGADAAGFRLPARGVLVLALLCLLIMILEGAIGDWGGVYLRRDLEAAPGLRVGPVALVRGGAVLTLVPLLAMLAVGEPVLTLACLFLAGLGVANGVPLMFSAAGRRPGGTPGPDIAAVSSLGSLGFLAGPPLVGGVAEATTLPWALAGLSFTTLAVLAYARRAVGTDL